MDALFFSIVIPTYNSVGTLSISLDSILNQNFTNYEVLVMDGGSTDNTVQIARDYNDSRIKITSEPDKGIYDAMNKGIAKAKGEWLYFLGSDDSLLNSEVLKDVHHSIQQTKSRIVYGNVKISGQTQWADDGAIYDGEFTLGKLLRANISHQAIFYHRSVFQKLGKYNPLYNVCADYDFNLRCFSKYPFSYLPITIGLFNAGGASSVNSDESFVADMWINIVKYFGLGIFRKAFTRHHRRFLPVRHFFLSHNAISLYVLTSAAIVYHKGLKFLNGE